MFLLEELRTRHIFFSPGFINVYKQPILVAASKYQVCAQEFSSSTWDTHPRT